MKNKSGQATRRKSAGKVRDLAAQKDSRGGAQKKEDPGPAVDLGATRVRPTKPKLS